MSVTDRGPEFQPALYDDIAPGYYDQVYARGRGLQWFWHHHRFVSVASLLPARGNTLLDMGCGPGTFLGHFAGGYVEGVGIDLARPQIEYAERTYGSAKLRFEAADVAAFREGRTFDAIVSI